MPPGANYRSQEAGPSRALRRDTPGMPPRLVFWIGAVLIGAVIVAISSAFDWSAEIWQAIAVGLFIGLLFRYEEPFVRWWTAGTRRRTSKSG